MLSWELFVERLPLSGKIQRCGEKRKCGCFYKLRTIWAKVKPHVRLMNIDSSCFKFFLSTTYNARLKFIIFDNKWSFSIGIIISYVCFFPIPKWFFSVKCLILEKTKHIMNRSLNSKVIRKWRNYHSARAYASSIFYLPQFKVSTESCFERIEINIVMWCAF